MSTPDFPRRALRCGSYIYTGPRFMEPCKRPAKWHSPDGPVCGYHKRAWLPEVIRPLVPA